MNQMPPELPAQAPANVPAQPVGVAGNYPPVVRTQSLTMRFGNLTALDNLTFELHKGDVFGFIGPNGAGKSTAMKILAGLLTPTSGSAELLGKPVRGNGDFVRRNVGYMPDFLGVYDDLTVTEYLEFFASAYHVPRASRKSTVHDVLELTDLSYKRNAMVSSLSRGMTQRLSLARVLVHDPPVLLLDEPASGLDPRARIEIRELIRELQRMGKTMIVSSHILSELGEFCNKLGIIERGKLLVFGTLDDLMARARTAASIAVKVVPEDIVRARDALHRDPRISTAEIRDDTLHIGLADPTAHHYFLIERLVAEGIRVHSVMPEQLKLEDVFLRLTKGLVN